MGGEGGSRLNKECRERQAAGVLIFLKSFQAAVQFLVYIKMQAQALGKLMFQCQLYLSFNGTLCTSIWTSGLLTSSVR